jgi:hypothetical protein
MNIVVRKVLVGGLFCFGITASMATSEVPTADISDVSEDVRLVLDASQPTAAFDASVTVNADSAISSGTGQIGLALAIDTDAVGGFSATITSNSETQTIDIVDTQAQGSARIGIDAFNDCGGASTCEEPLTIDFVRTDDGEGSIGLTFSLDALASTDSEEGGTGTITFVIQ